MRIEDRPEAGRRPAARLADLLAGEPVVLAITASGVTVAREIAQRLFAPLVERLRAPDDVRLFLERSGGATREASCRCEECTDEPGSR